MKILLKSLGYLALIFLTVLIVYSLGFYFNWYGKLEGPGVSVTDPYPEKLLEAKKISQADILDSPKQILFGDTHVHTTYSTDAFLWSLPVFNGEGPHPISDACDYARFCSALDFWVTTDHAEASTPRKWSSIKQAVRNCNAPSDKADPDMVTFLGYEWTQVGLEAGNHYGHKNVVFKDIEEDNVPARPIGAGGLATQGMRVIIGQQAARLVKPLALADFSNRERYFNFGSFVKELNGIPFCEEGVSSDLLPVNCYESADTPEDLFLKLKELKMPSIVIPHGNTWGFYSPPGTSLDKQLEPGFHDPNVQVLFEIMSGHGNSEEYRPWRAMTYDSEGLLSCPDPSKDYLPSCWRAGEIIKERCLKEGSSNLICEEREKEARIDYLNAQAAGHTTVQGAEFEDWLDSGQCKDCFIPSFNYRPAGSGQYALAIGNFSSNEVNRFRFGFIASSDNHRARPGTGYKEIDRMTTTDANGQPSETLRSAFYPKEERIPRSVKSEMSLDPDNPNTRGGFGAFEAERMASFFTTGGLAAVHSDGRGREDIWDSMQRKETYATSGDRILLWFNLIKENISIPMGGEIKTSENPTFTVKAVGALKQKPGCPDFGVTSFSTDDIETLCKNECYNPSDERKIITRIEVIKINPQLNSKENVSDLVKDPWKVFNCPSSESGCSVTFSDDSFLNEGRDAAYYVRAIEESSPTINSENLRCELDDAGQCAKVNACYGDYRTSKEDDCLSMSEERAWSSPIFVDFADL
ncbi:MAG: DUF3604 domain-containing protein [SAR86 cluster bacterium]|jgi:hypothetical protein|nr:DUF3604 domain-containing protein [SAR86 cluster bacterium]